MARVYHERSADREYARDLSTVGARLSGMVRFRTDAACAGSVTDEMPANLPFRLESGKQNADSAWVRQSPWPDGSGGDRGETGRSA